MRRLPISGTAIGTGINADPRFGKRMAKALSDLSGVKFFAMTGHEHQFGTNVRVATVTSASDPGQTVYDVPGWT